ncbi:hypothetical protein BC827DRAFT_1178086 [Russula dissimulans]|nr:hypothetical protein BC827DRAFT_1178086 [Russula dissimulans]
MSTPKHWRPSAAEALSQEPDRQRQKHATSSSYHKASETRAAGRDKEDAKYRLGRGYVSDGPPPPSQTPAPAYLASAQSFATASKASHNASMQPHQGQPAYLSQKAPPSNTPPQETHSAPQRHWEATPDPRAASHRTTTTTDKAPFMPTDPIRHAEDHYKSSRHRPRRAPTPAPESTEPQPAPNWPRPPSFLKKVTPEVREREKEQSRNRLKEELKAHPKAKDRGRADRAQEHIIRDQRDPRHEEERRHYKEERRREKERRREEEQRHDERRHGEQRIKDDHVHKSTRDQERRRESHVPIAPQGRDPRLMRVTVKDSDESDNSLMKPPGSIRPKRHHKDQTMTPIVPTVLRQPTSPVPPAQVPTTQTEINPASNLNDSRRMPTLTQPPQATPSSSNEKSGSKAQRGSPPRNLTVPYPPGYAVSASDSEHVMRKEHRPKIVEMARSIDRPRTSGGHRVSIAHDAVSKPPVAQPVQPPFEKSSHKSEKPSKGRFSAWLHHRAPSNSHPMPPTARAVPPSSTRNDIPEAIPQVLSIRAGEGPADYVQEYGARRVAPPAVTPVATDAAVRQPLPTTFNKQPRDAPHTVAGAQLDLPGHASSTHVFSSQPWVQQAQWTTEPQPLSPVVHPLVVPSPVVFPASLASPPTLVDTQQQPLPRPPLQGPPNHQESYARSPEPPWHNLTTNGRSPAPPVHSHTVPLPSTGGGQRASPKGVSPMIHDAATPKHPRYSSVHAGYANAQPSYMASPASPKGVSPMIHDAATPKHPRYSSVPTGYANAQASYMASPPSRPIAPDLAAVFPIREDNTDAYRHPPQGERPQGTQQPKETLEHWDRHRHNQDNVARMVVSTVPSSERTPRSTKASPNLHPRPMNQGTPPKPPSQPIAYPTFPLQSSTTPDVLHAHDSSRPGVYNMPNQNSNPSAYPATSIYPSSSPRTLAEPHVTINNPPVANAPSNNPSPKIKSGNPSPRSRAQVDAPSQGPTTPVVHVTTRTPSHETGSTTLLGKTPSSQGSGSIQFPMSSPAHPQAVASRITTHGGQQPSAPVSDSLGDRNANATSHNQVPITHPTGSRHHHSHSAPVVSVSSLAQASALAQAQMQSLPRAAGPVSPTPIRSYSTAQIMGDPQVVRIPVPGYSSTPVPNHRLQRDVIPSPSQDSELNTPSSLAVSTKLPIVSDEPLAPVMSSQSFQEPKKKGGFFQGLGLFRSRSSAQKRHPHEAKVPVSDARAQTAATTTKVASKAPAPLHYDSDSKVVTTPSKLKKLKSPRTPMPTVAPQPSHPLQPPPTPKPAPAPSFTAAKEERFSSAPNAFATFRFVSKRKRTMSGASAEACDGTNAGSFIEHRANA